MLKPNEPERPLFQAVCRACTRVSLFPGVSYLPSMLTAGLMGASLVFGIAAVIPQIGAGPFTVMLLLGQLVSAMVISHFGLLGSPVNPINMTSGAGAVLLFVGAYLATRG